LYRSRKFGRSGRGRAAVTGWCGRLVAMEAAGSQRCCIGEHRLRKAEVGGTEVGATRRLRLRVSLVANGNLAYGPPNDPMERPVRDSCAFVRCNEHCNIHCDCIMLLDPIDSIQSQNDFALTWSSIRNILSQQWQTASTTATINKYYFKPIRAHMDDRLVP
jgi:hypothetical protein